MTTEFDEPVPIPHGVPLAAREIEFSGVLPLPRFSGRSLPSIDLVLAHRCSRREFGPLALAAFADFVWLSLRTLAVRRNSLTEHRPLPSFGGLHVVQCVFLNVPGKIANPALYDSQRHTLALLNASGEIAQAVIAAFSRVIPVGSGTLIIFAADIDRAQSVYEHPESLIWRDAGVMLGGMSLVAEALGLSFCATGRVGQAEVAKLFSTGRWMAAGGAILGSRVDVA